MSRPVHLAVQLPDSADFASLVRIAQTAERGLFDFVYLSAGFDSLTAMSAIAGVAENIGLVGAIDTTFSEPYEASRRLASLDHLSGGRAGAAVLTSSDAAVGENYRRGGYLPESEKYRRAEQFVSVVRAFWDSWAVDAVLADVDAGIYADPSRIHAVEYQSPQFDVRGVAALPAGPQGHPVLVYEDDSDAGRALGSRHADVMITRGRSVQECQAYYADVKSRVAAWGRDPQRVRVFARVSDANEVIRLVDADACDGFLLTSGPGELEQFVADVVSELQQRGIHRTQYGTTTLRAHLGL